MPPVAPRARSRRGPALLALALCACAAAAAPADAARRPSAAALARQDARLADEQRAVDARLDRERAALAGARVRLDEARTAYEGQLSSVQRRLRAIYAHPEPGALAQVLAADPADVAAAADLARAVGRRDRDLIARFRSTSHRLRAVQAEVVLRKQALLVRRRDLAVQRAILAPELRAARRRAAAQRAAAARAAAARSALAVPLAATSQWSGSAPYTPQPTARASERGLPSQVVAGRTLPGTLGQDASGRPQVVVARAGYAAAASPYAAPPRVAVPSGSVLTAAGAAAGATQAMVASWYGEEFAGRPTASGERFDPGAMTAAHRTLPFGTMLRVTHGVRWVVVRVNDRGPYVQGRDLDLSRAAAEALSLAGVGQVQVEVLTAAPGT